MSERKITSGVGAVLILLGLRHGSFGGLFTAGLGGASIYRGSADISRCTNPSASTRASKAKVRAGTILPARDSRQAGVHDQPLAGGAVYLLAKARQPTAVHGAPGIGDRAGRKTLALGRARPGGLARRVGCRNHQRQARPAIAWRSLAGAEVDNAGSVRFVPGRGDRGTEVHIVMDYIPPAGRVGKWVATLFGKNPESTIREELRNFKRIMEIGEVPTTQGQPRGTCRGRGKRKAKGSCEADRCR